MVINHATQGGPHCRYHHPKTPARSKSTPSDQWHVGNMLCPRPVAPTTQDPYLIHVVHFLSFSRARNDEVMVPKNMGKQQKPSKPCWFLHLSSASLACGLLHLHTDVHIQEPKSQQTSICKQAPAKKHLPSRNIEIGKQRSDSRTIDFSNRFPCLDMLEIIAFTVQIFITVVLAH